MFSLFLFQLTRLRRSIPMLVLLAGLLGGIPSAVQACGESLFRVGKGVIYREYTAPLPGKILIVAQGEAELAFVDVLRRTGHEMTVVSSSEAVGAALADEQFDIVMAHYTDHPAVAGQIQSSGARVAELPVAAEGELDQARDINPNAPRLNDPIKRYLKAIHRTLTSRSA